MQRSTKHRAPAKYRVSPLSEVDDFPVELEPEGTSCLARFEQKLDHLHSVEDLGHEEMILEQPKPEEDLAEPPSAKFDVDFLAEDYDDPIERAYKESLRISRARRNGKYPNEIFVPRARKIRRQWEHGLRLESTSDVSEVLKDEKHAVILHAFSSIPTTALNSDAFNRTIPQLSAHPSSELPQPHVPDPVHDPVLSTPELVLHHNSLAETQVFTSVLHVPQLPFVPTEEDSSDLPRERRHVFLNISNDDDELDQLIEPYISYAKCHVAFGKEETRSWWEKTVELLKNRSPSQNVDDKYLNVLVLLRLVQQGDYLQILFYLKDLAILWDLEEVAEEYFDLCFPLHAFDLTN